MQHNLPNNKDLFELWVDTSNDVKKQLQKIYYLLCNLEHMNDINENILNFASDIKREIDMAIELSEILRTSFFHSLNKYCRGFKLVRDDYLLLILARVLKSGQIERDFDTFMNFYYQDGSLTGYIDITAEPTESKSEFSKDKVRAKYRLGNEIPPEEVKIINLKEAQVAFFKQNYPEIYDRFK